MNHNVKPSCIDCKYVNLIRERRGVVHCKCKHIQALIRKDDITGENIYQSCALTRHGTAPINNRSEEGSLGGQCGDDGKLFEPKRNFFKRIIEGICRS